MVAFFRQFLVILLVLLQNAAPLVHAHTGKDGSQGGFHLSEFETLRIAADHMSLSSIIEERDAKSCVVNIGSAIKHQQLCKLPQSIFFIAASYPTFAIPRQTKPIIYSTDSANVSLSAFYNHNTSRAPPFC